MFKDFYEKNIYKKFYKKTTPEEKKEVVKNTGDWFPEQHDNKIKGMDKVIANYTFDGTEQHKEARAGYLWKKCEVCGKEFEGYRGRSKYCKECAVIKKNEAKNKYSEKKKAEKEEQAVVTQRIQNIAKARAYRNGSTFEYELLKIMNGTSPVRAENKKSNKAEERRNRRNAYQREYLKKQRTENTTIMTPVGEANLRMRECASKRASNRGTNYLDELSKIIDGTEPIRDRAGNPNFTHATTVIETKDKVEPKPQEPQEPQVDYLEIMQKAIAIVKAVKATEDVKECVNSVYDILSKGE